eukprot:scaffold3767_cov114-Isochrysis_galbana.AAC.49
MGGLHAQAIAGRHSTLGLPDGRDGRPGMRSGQRCLFPPVDLYHTVLPRYQHGLAYPHRAALQHIQAARVGEGVVSGMHGLLLVGTCAFVRLAGHRGGTACVNIVGYECGGRGGRAETVDGRMDK